MPHTLLLHVHLNATLLTRQHFLLDSTLLPPEIYFTTLLQVYLSANLLTGSIPPEIGRLHKTLEILDLRSS